MFGAAVVRFEYIAELIVRCAADTCRPASNCGRLREVVEPVRRPAAGCCESRRSRSCRRAAPGRWPPRAERRDDERERDSATRAMHWNTGACSPSPPGSVPRGPYYAGAHAASVQQLPRRVERRRALERGLERPAAAEPLDVPRIELAQVPGRALRPRCSTAQSSTQSSSARISVAVGLAGPRTPSTCSNSHGLPSEPARQQHAGRAGLLERRRAGLGRVQPARRPAPARAAPRPAIAPARSRARPCAAATRGAGGCESPATPPSNTSRRATSTPLRSPGRWPDRSLTVTGSPLPRAARPRHRHRPDGLARAAPRRRRSCTPSGPGSPC